MKILFMMNPLKTDAQNYKIVKILTDELRLDNELYFVYPSYTRNEYKRFRKVNNNFTYFFYNSKKYYNFSNYELQREKGLKRIVTSILNKPHYFILYLWRKIISVIKKNSLESLKFQKLLEKTILQIEPDVIVAVSNPFEHALVITKIRSSAIKVWYQLDPHTLANQFNRKYFEIELGKEYELLKCVDLVFVQPYNKNSILNSKFNVYEYKIKSIEFPLIKNTDKMVIDYKMSKKFINIVYAGSIDYNIRNPKVVFESLNQLEIRNLKLHIYTSSRSIYLEEDLKKFNSLIEYHGYQDLQAMEKIMKEADFLLNIGNDNNIYFPSKIFEYISTGKPIINFYKVENCNTLSIIKKYPLGFNIYEGVAIDNLPNIKKFILENINKKIGFREIYDRFSLFTPKKVKEKFMSIIEEKMKEKNEKNNN